MTDYDALRAAAKAATPGPWGQRVDDVRSIYGGNDELVVDTCGWDRDYDNAVYIAAASPDVVLRLLDVAEAMERQAIEFRARAKRAEAKVAAVEAIVDATAVCGSHGVEWRPECRECIGAEAVTMSDRVLTEALRGPQDAATADLTAAAPHSDQPDAHHDGERGGEAGGRA